MAEAVSVYLPPDRVFYDREEIRRDLKSRFLSGQTNVVLYGPRRYGKSSLVAELTADLEKAGITCVTLDVMKVPSIELFAAVYVQKLLPKGKRAVIAEFLRSV